MGSDLFYKHDRKNEILRIRNSTITYNTLLYVYDTLTYRVPPFSRYAKE